MYFLSVPSIGGGVVEGNWVGEGGEIGHLNSEVFNSCHHPPNPMKMKSEHLMVGQLLCREHHEFTSPWSFGVLFHDLLDIYIGFWQ